MIGVDCVFNLDGTVTVRRIKEKGVWTSVEQGRQWIERDGRHILVMIQGQPPRELLLRSDTLTWELRPDRNQKKVWV